MSLADEVAKLDALKDKGALTEEQYKQAVARLLDNAKVSPRAVTAINALRRSRSDRWIGGVAGGLAEATGLDNWVWRLIFAVLLLFGGAGLIVYILMWIFVPAESDI